MAYDPIIYGGSKSSVKGYASSRSKYFDELEKERKKKEEDPIFNSSNRADIVKENKGLFSGALDIVKGVASAGGDLAVGTVKTGKNLADESLNRAAIAREQDKTRRNQSQAEAINKKYQDEENKRVWKGYENAKSVDELPAERQQAWEYLRKHRQLELDRNDAQNKTGDRSKLNDLYKTQAKEAEEFDESAKQMYRGAQYVQGVGTGVESLGTVAAKFAGDDSDINKRLIELTQGKDWDKLTDEEKKAALTQRDLGAALSLLDVTPIGAVATGAKTTAKSGLKAGLKAGANAFSKSAANQSVREVAKAGFGGLVKQAGKSTLSGAVVGAGLGTGINAAMGGEDWQSAAKQGAISGAAGGFLGSPFDIDVKSSLKGSVDTDVKAPDIDVKNATDDVNVTKEAYDPINDPARKAEYDQMMANKEAGLNYDGSRIINTNEVKAELDDMKNGKYSDDLYDIVDDSGNVVEPEFIQAATEKQVAALTAKRDEMAAQVDAIESPEARELAMKNVNKLDGQISSIVSGDTKAIMDTGVNGVTRRLNTDRVKERFSKLQTDLAESNFRERRAQREAAKRDAPIRTFDEMSGEIDAIGAGGVAPDAVTPREDFVDIDEVIRHPSIPAPVKGRATSLAKDLADAELELAGLMTKGRADELLDNLTDEFNQKASKIELMPEPRRTDEMAALQENFEKSYGDIKSKMQEDADIVNELTRVKEQIEANMNEVLAESNVLKDQNPTEFGKVDQELNQKISQEIEQEAESAIFNRMSNEEGVPDSENISKAFAEIPEGITPEKLDSLPAVNKLAQEALTDLWINDEANLLEHSLQGVSRSSLGLGLSSPSHNIRRMFGEVGRLVNGSILEAFHKTNLASKYDAALFTKIQKAFGGDRAVYKAAVDIVEGKLDVDASGFTQQQLDGLEMFQRFWEKSKRMVQKAAAQEVMADFDARSYNGDFRYKTEEIKSLAKRDGITIAEATQKYSGNTGFKKSDVIYLANQASERATRQNYFAHMLDEELVSKNVKQEFRDSVAERQSSGEFRHTDDELAILASRDGTGIEAARAKYGERGFNERDAKYVERIMAHDAVTRAKKDFGGDAVTANIKFGNMMKRLTNSDNYSRDIIDVMVRYSAGLNKKVYLEPALRKLDNAKLVLEKSKIDTKIAKDWINTYEKQLKINNISKTGEAFNEAVDAMIRKVRPDSSMIGNNHYRSSLAAQRLVNSFGMLGLSFRNGLQQTSQIVTAVSKLGWENVAPGMIEHVKNLSNPKTRAAYRESLERASVINAGFVDDAFTDLIGSTRAKAVQDTGEFLSKYLMFMSRVTDEFVRGTTYQAALREGLSGKLPMGKAQTRAAAMAAELNFLTTKADMPTKLNGDGIRSLTQFMTFSYKQAEAWKDIGIDSVKDPVTGTYKFKPKELQRLLQGVVTAGVAFQMMESVAGIDTEDNIPFLGNFTDGTLPMSPLMALTIGKQNQPGIPQLLNDIANPDGADDYEREQNRQDSIEKFRDMLIRSFVPAGSQMKKTYDGFQSIENDGVVMKDGKVKYVQNTDDASKLKALTIGQYSTEAGREWVNRKFPTLSEKQSAIVEKQKTKEAKERAYQFYAGLKGVKTKSSIVKRAKEVIESQPNKAARLISEHNAQVSKVIDEYIAKYGELSDYEKEYIAERYYIKTKNKED